MNVSCDAGVASPVGATVDTYNVRNQLVEVQTSPSSIANLTTAATYVYDDAGNRVEETVAGPSTSSTSSGQAGSGQSTTTSYVIDAHNPTGYPKPIKQWTSTAGGLNGPFARWDHLYFRRFLNNLKPRIAQSKSDVGRIRS